MTRLHRQWMTEQMELHQYTMNWARELGLCGKLLDMDDRNCKGSSTSSYSID